MNAGDGFAGPDTLATVAAALRRAADVDLLFGGTILLLPRGAAGLSPAAPRRARLRYGLPACHQATYVRRVLHLAVPHDLAYRVSSDYYTIARLCRAGARTLCLDRPLALHDFGPQNLSQRETLTRLQRFRRDPAPGAGAGLAGDPGQYRAGSSASTGPTSWCRAPGSGRFGAVLLRPWRGVAGAEACRPKPWPCATSCSTCDHQPEVILALSRLWAARPRPAPRLHQSARAAAPRRRRSRPPGALEPARRRASPAQAGRIDSSSYFAVD